MMIAQRDDTRTLELQKALAHVDRLKGSVNQAAHQLEQAWLQRHECSPEPARLAFRSAAQKYIAAKKRLELLEKEA